MTNVSVVSNSSPWTNKSIERLVRVAVRGSKRRWLGVVVATDDKLHCRFDLDSLTLILGVPELTPLTTIANAARRRPRLDSATAMQLATTIRDLVGLRGQQPTCLPQVVGRARPRQRKQHDDTPIGRAREKLDKAERRAKHYASLLARAERDVRKATGVVKRLETRQRKARSFGPRLAQN